MTGGKSETSTIHVPGHFVFDEPELAFSCTDSKARHVHPLVGLSQFGPFSASQLAVVPDIIRVALIAPYGRIGELRRFINELNSSHVPKERKKYLIEYPGFSQVFRTGLVTARNEACRELPKYLDEKISKSNAPHSALAEAVKQELQTLDNMRHEFSVVLLLLPTRWQTAFRVRDELQDFDLHHYLKAVSASKYIPLQITNDNEGSAFRYACRCSVMWRLGIALYTKAGGTPWTWADSPPDTAYIGLGYAMINRGDTKKKFAICCSQVFDANGTGLEFVAYEAEDVRIFRGNPFLTREQMLGVISRSIDIYQRKHYGKKPKHVIVHKNTEFKPDEVDGCFDALKAIENIDLVHVKQMVPWNAVHINTDRNGRIQVDGFPCLRGTSLCLGGKDSLLWIHGNSHALALSGSYYKGAKGLPSPVQLVRYAGHGTMDEISRSVLALSKMDWNSDGPYTQLPVTLNFAHVMAQIVARIPKLESKPYPIRFFM